MELFDIIGIVIIVAAALKGGRRGFVVTLGRLCAGILSLLLVYLLNTWAFAQLVPTLLVDHQVIIVRVLLCVVLYIVLFLVLKTIILSLRILTGLPIIKGLNKLRGGRCLWTSAGRYFGYDPGCAAYFLMYVIWQRCDISEIRVCVYDLYDPCYVFSTGYIRKMVAFIYIRRYECQK